MKMYVFVPLQVLSSFQYTAVSKTTTERLAKNLLVWTRIALQLRLEP